MSIQLHVYTLTIYHHNCNSTELASGIVSTALQCGTGRCPTDDLVLNSPVLVSIQHSDVIKVSVIMVLGL